jgi:hypothetical protein
VGSGSVMSCAVQERQQLAISVKIKNLFILFVLLNWDNAGQKYGKIMYF